MRTIHVTNPHEVRPVPKRRLHHSPESARAERFVFVVERSWRAVEAASQEGLEMTERVEQDALIREGRNQRGARQKSCPVRRSGGRRNRRKLTLARHETKRRGSRIAGSCESHSVRSLPSLPRERLREGWSLGDVAARRAHSRCPRKGKHEPRKYEHQHATGSFSS
jgi:hypothetical protein